MPTGVLGGLWDRGLAFSCSLGDSPNSSLALPESVPHPWLLPHLAFHRHGNTGDAMMSPELQKSSPLLELRGQENRKGGV